MELDACVMHGPSRRAASVAPIRGIKTPSKVAEIVMERSDYIMIVGDGALRFAKAHGFVEEDLLTDKARLAWLTWKESLGSDWGPAWMRRRTRTVRRFCSNVSRMRGRIGLPGRGK